MRRSHASPGYNLQMIRDFLEQLLWEYRLFDFEHRTGSKANSPEMEESYQKYYRNYGVVLLPRNCLRDDVQDPKLWSEADATFRAQLIEASQGAIDAIEAAMPYISTALHFVEGTGGNPDHAIVRRASQVLGIDPPVRAKLPEPFKQMPLHYLDELVNPDLQAVFKKADVVVGVDEQSGQFITFFGIDRMQNIIDTGREEVLGMLGFVIDARTSELEQLLVLTEELKGSHCYPMS